jgi:hypothetical protein
MIVSADKVKHAAVMILQAHQLCKKDLQEATDISLQRRKRRSAVESLIETARTDLMFSRSKRLLSPWIALE